MSEHYGGVQMVVDDPDEATRLASSGHSVVLIVPDHLVPGLQLPSGSARVATFVGDANDPKDRSGAEEMDRELFGLDG